MTALSPIARVRARAAVEQALRDTLRAKGMIEVATPTLVASPGMEPQLRAFTVPSHHCPQLGHRYLHTSPEYAIKATFGALDADVFTLARSYRDEPLTRWHHPEFTMLEWYRRCDGLAPLMEDVEHLVLAAWDAVAALRTEPPLRERPRAPFERLTVSAAFERWLGVDILEAPTEHLRAVAADRGWDANESWDRETLFSLLYAFGIEPELARTRPVFLTEFPAAQAALARLRPDDPRVALRFEVYAGATDAQGTHTSVELANAFAELTDPIEQRARFEADIVTRRAEGAPVYPMPEPMLAGLAGMPLTSGIALGVERLIVWAMEHAWGERLAVRELLLGEPAAPWR